MKDLKSIDLREKSIPELEAMAADLRAELYRARRDLVFRKITDTTGLKVRRHSIARILAVVTEKKRGEA